MNRLWQRYATPSITWLFIVSLVSGIALFFHVGQSAFRGMHEWLSMVLIIPFVLHIARNWRPFLNYFRHGPMIATLVLSLAAGGVFAYQGMSGSSGNPMFAVLNAVGKSSIAEVAAIFDTTPEALNEALKEKGYKIDNPQASLSDIAAASGRPQMALMADLASLGK